MVADTPSLLPTRSELGGESPMAESTDRSDVDPKLLELLVCPLTKGPLRYVRERQELVSDQAGLAYPVRDGIPIMLVDEARQLDEDEQIPTTVRARSERDGV
jgi:uncharacterized protein YbaR (Trm112 family)